LHELAGDQLHAFGNRVAESLGVPGGDVNGDFGVSHTTPAWKLLTAAWRRLFAGALPPVFLDTGGATGPASKIVKARSPDPTTSNELDILYVLRVHHERSLNSDVVADSANGKRRARTASTNSNDHPFEDLRAGTVGLRHPNTHLDGVSRSKSVDVFVWLELDQLVCFHEYLPA
jgi:hypothetical protein